jgi:hypothetical protein
MTTPTGPGITAPPQVPTFVGLVRTPVPVGQNLTPNPNVNAPAGMGGDRWGANGGGIAPTVEPQGVLANASRCVRAVDSQFDVNNQTVMGAMSRGVVSTKTADQVGADDSTSQVWTADQQSPDVADSQL